MIKKEGAKYVVRSESGRNLGTYASREAAEKRLQQVEAFKHMDKRGGRKK